MPWRYEYSKTFAEKARALEHGYLKSAVKDLLAQILDLDDPRDRGGRYLHTDLWAYPFCGRHFLVCHIDEARMTVFFRTIVS